MTYSNMTDSSTLYSSTKYTKLHFLFHAFVASALILTANTAAADTALQSGSPVGLNLAASTFIPNFYLDVDGSARQLMVNVTGNSGDFDLFLRFGSPFPEQSTTTTVPTVSEDLLNRYAHYHSISSASTESISVLPSSRIPLHTGRWYIAVINASESFATGTLTATTAASAPVGSITLDFANPSTGNSDPTNDCDDSFWTDTTAAAAVGGNTATTLGLQRRNALAFAAQELVQQLQIPDSITVHACGAHLGGTAQSAILAHAAPLSYLFDDPQFPIAALPKKYTWYSSTAAVRLAGTSECGLGGGDCNGVDNEEIEATFNEDIGKATIVGGEQFYLGFDADPTPNHSLDFVSIAMHEMTHGLGFFGLVNLDATQGPVGAKAGIATDSSGNLTIAFTGLSDGPYDDIYDESIAIVNSNDSVYTPFMGYEVNGSGDAARAVAVTSGPTITSDGQYIPGNQTGIRWSDPVAANASGVNANFGKPAPDDFPSLYAPCDESKTPTCATQPSSTLSHTIQPGDMMNAFYSSVNLRQMGLAVPMLAPLGWSNAAVATPVYGQPIPSNWFDRTHSGHGFDFQLLAHDPTFGQDTYFLTFYTYESDGTPEWYQAAGSLVDGIFIPSLQANGSTLYRLVYTTTPTSIVSYSLDDTSNGSVIVDFNQASQSPACRNVDRSNASQLAVMSWSIGADSGQWCVEPIVPISAHASPDFNGHWYAPSDSGWGMEILDVSTAAAPSIFVYMYYPGPDGQPAWATGSGTLNNNTVSMPLQQIADGYCRTCTPPAQLTANSIGTITLRFDPHAPNPTAAPTGAATILANYPAGGGFDRTNIAIQMLSVQTGQ